jgi:ankyrin repeat protein|eukprot:CAMPEP_0174283498 /NCGR_PEP_ID=MMETSP0809-20121228/4201_1 /TAXON_ID=73025 ORGANISM="Eutreptiella gymnastica-like, Strain CCMP1594" /NCGR_SAMPLE_ID=MMETSP0809 /ASSEMBLY_ACC=CAM_ASM_000658 /LENGTH=261 /DNA_ID=CAMNT_0015378485 /DNA_START=57 /DNA_END=842 /DNA_ORIENTATION=-
MSKNETVVLPDGTSVGVTRPNSIDDQTWASVKEYLQKNPNNAKTMQKAVQEMTENPMKQEQFREVMALAEHMKNDQSVPTKLQGLASDPQLASAFNEMKAGGMDAVMKYYNDENFLRLVSQKMGGVPKEMKAAMMNLHECVRAGDLNGVQKHLSHGTSPDKKDEKGISALHYAVGVNRLDILKCLMDARADPKVTDGQGNTLLHYAAGYGHVQTTDYFLQCGLPVNAANNAGETPLDLAVRNNHASTVSALRAKGAQPGRK